MHYNWPYGWEEKVSKLVYLFYVVCISLIAFGFGKNTEVQVSTAFIWWSSAVIFVSCINICTNAIVGAIKESAKKHEEATGTPV